MPLDGECDCGTESDGRCSEDFCTFCYRDGRFVNDVTMELMIEHCADLRVGIEHDSKVSREEYIGQLKQTFPRLKRWSPALELGRDNPLLSPSLAGVEEMIGRYCDTLQVTYIASVDDEGFPCLKAMLSPRLRDGIRIFYFTTNTFSLRVAQYRSNPRASIYFCCEREFSAVMLRGNMEVLTDQTARDMIWRDGDEEYYPGGRTDPNYCVLRFTAIDGRVYGNYDSRPFIIGK